MPSLTPNFILRGARLVTQITKRSLPVIKMAKRVVDYAQNSHLDVGVKYEQQNFYATFALQEQKEGMQAFIEKRQAKWVDE